MHEYPVWCISCIWNLTFVHNKRSIMLLSFLKRGLPSYTRDTQLSVRQACCWAWFGCEFHRATTSEAMTLPCCPAMGLRCWFTSAFVDVCCFVCCGIWSGALYVPNALVLIVWIGAYYMFAVLFWVSKRRVKVVEKFWLGTGLASKILYLFETWVWWGLGLCI
jgi:hypothetical protein